MSFLGTRVEFNKGSGESDATSPPPTPPALSLAQTYSVLRLDDNGHVVPMRAGLELDEAERLVDEFSARGHKQMYYVEKDRLFPQR